MDFEKILLDFPPEATEQLADPALSIFWKNFQDRTFWINREIDESTMDIVDYIIMCNREDKGIPVEERKPIKLLINSPGGMLDVAESVIDMIAISKTPVYGYAMGCVASAASLIFLSCHKRFALKSAYLILHKGSANMSGNYNEMMQAVEDYQKQVERMVSFYIEKTTLPEEVVREKIKTDWYLHREECLEYGIITDESINIDDIV